MIVEKRVWSLTFSEGVWYLHLLRLARGALTVLKVKQQNIKSKTEIWFFSESQAAVFKLFSNCV